MNTPTHFRLVAGVLFLSLLFTSCRQLIPPPVIAISKASDNYINWLRRADSTVRYVNLYHLPVDSATAVLEQCNGLLLTGGDDVYPGIYDKEGDTARCEGFDLYRDTLEINLIYKALELDMPIFGVCRGEQLLNVVFEGTLIIDIPQDVPSSLLHRCEDYRSCFHMVYVEPNSLLHRICDCDSALVTTNHHQAIGILAPDFKVNAYSPDHLIEGVELARYNDHLFILAVQWHPERMEASNPLSGPLAEAFLKQCRVFIPKR